MAFGLKTIFKTVTSVAVGTATALAALWVIGDRKINKLINDRHNDKEAFKDNKNAFLDRTARDGDSFIPFPRQAARIAVACIKLEGNDKLPLDKKALATGVLTFLAGATGGLTAAQAIAGEGGDQPLAQSTSAENNRPAPTQAVTP